MDIVQQFDPYDVIVYTNGLIVVVVVVVHCLNLFSMQDNKNHQDNLWPVMVLYQMT